MAHTLRDGSEDAPNPAAAPAIGPRTDWLALSLAILAPILIVHFCVVRPNTQQLAQMREQVAQLESTIQQLHAKAPAAAGAASLMESLAQQEAIAIEAEATLNRVKALQRRLASQTASLECSSSKLDRLAELDERIDRQGDLLVAATDALSTYASLPAELQAAVERAGRVAPAIADLKRLGDTLAATDELTEQAIGDVGQALDQQRELVLGTASLAAASETLEGLVELENRLNAPLMAVAAAHERLDDLMRLKSALLDQTENLPEAFDTLELMVTLQMDYRRASGVFRTLQRLLADLVLLEPSIARVATAVEPMLERTALSRLGGDELRLVLRELRKRHAQAVQELELAEQSPAPSRAERIAARPQD
ncbi:MAG: hypothetical protein AAFV43_02970 [Planctomycetota bacterium]